MDIKELAEVIGFEGDASTLTKDAAMAHLNERFISRENAVKDPEIKKKVVGSVLGSLGVKAAQTFGLKSSEVNDKQLEDVFELAKNKYDNELKALKEGAGKTDDERAKEYEKQISLLKGSITDLETTLGTREAEYTGKIGELSSALKNTKLSVKLDKANSAIPFTDEFVKDPIKKRGFYATISDKYNVDLAEDDNVVVTDKQGNPIKHPKTAGKYASYEDVLQIEAETNGFLKKNNSEVVTKRVITLGGESKSVDNKRVHPKARQHADKLGA